MHDDAAPREGFDGEITITAARNAGAAPPDAGMLEARFARFAGGQQLTLWLPASGFSGYADLHVCLADGRSLRREPVRQLLSGNVQVLLDTQSWPPGEITLQVTHASGWCHELELRKSAGPAAPLPRSAVQADPGDDLRRRDIEREALRLRLARRVETRAMGRGGVLVYHDGAEGAPPITFDYEFGNAAVLVFTPPAARWEAATGHAADRRDEIVRFVAEAARREHAPDWLCEVHADHIALVAPRRRR